MCMRVDKTGNEHRIGEIEKLAVLGGGNAFHRRAFAERDDASVANEDRPSFDDAEILERNPLLR